MGYLKSTGTVFIYIGLFLAVITFMPGLPPQTEFQEFSAKPTREIKLENRLNGVEKMFEGKLNAPENMDSYNGELYSGIHGGYVMRIEEDQVVPIAKFGEKCDGIWQEHKCGRPLGIKFDKKGNLYVVDTYYGIFKVNVATGEYKNIVNCSKSIEGKAPQLPNSIDVADNGDLYWTDSSTDFKLYDLMIAVLANPSGRLIRYNAATKKNEVLMRNLGLVNGLKLSDDESFVIVAELSSRITKYHLKGPKAGQQEVFLDGLPGIPDNIHSDGQGGFLITLIIAIDSEHPHLVHSFMPHPYLRKMLVRLLVTMELPFKLLHDIYPNTYTERIIHAIGSFQGAEMLIDPVEKSILLRVDVSGNIIDALSSNDGSFSRMSGSYIYNDYVWFSSPWLHYIGRVPLKQAFPDLADSAKQTSRTKNEKQSPSTGPSGVKMERVKRNADSTAAKPTKSDRASQAKPTAAPTTTPKPNVAPTPKPATAPTTSKPTAAPKPAPKVVKPAATGSGNAKPSEAKSSTNAETKKENAKTVGDAKFNAKSEGSTKKDDAAKVQSGKKSGQDASAKQTAQKSQPEKAKRVETNRPKDDL